MTVAARRVVLTGLACSALLALPAGAQSRTLRIVYPFPAGGAGDAVVRGLADHLQTSLGRPVIVENKTGAGGRIGAQAVKDAPADGSVLLFAAGAQFTLQPHVLANLGYDPFADFVPIARIVKFDQVLAASAQLGVTTVRGLADWMKGDPARAAFGSPGAGTGAHFAALEFARTFGLAARHIPYRGTPAALPDLLAGRLPAYLASAAELIEHHRNGGIRILACASAERSPAVPEAPTLRETGVEIEAPGWFAFYAPATTPRQVREQLHQAIAEAAGNAAIRASMERAGFQPTDSATNALQQIQQAEFEMWAAVVKASGYKPE